MINNKTYKPIIKSYPEYAHLFSILGDPESDVNLARWFSGNFIQLRYDTSDDVDEALFFEKDVEECNIYRCSLLEKLIFEKKMFENDDSFQKMAFHYLNEGFYIIVVLDHFYIPFDKERYNCSHKNHECLICGMDYENKMYLVQDFFNGIYTSCELSFFDFWRAYLNHYDYDIFDDEKIYLFKKKSAKDQTRLPFQISKIKSQIQNYICGEFSQIDNRVYGIYCFDKIVNKLKNNKFDYRDFSLLYEHALAMHIRAKLLTNLNIACFRNDFFDLSSSICNQMLIIRNLFFKQKISKRFHVKNQEQRLMDIKQQEIYIFREFLDRIS